MGTLLLSLYIKDVLNTLSGLNGSTCLSVYRDQAVNMIISAGHHSLWGLSVLEPLVVIRGTAFFGT